MTETKIDYESLTQDALRGVVRTILARVAQHEQLPGNHHFYISFNTHNEGVGLSKRLREQYPDEMTIVLQHRYWDLQVHDDRFEVKLTFNSIPERLVVPYSAIKVFFDPSVPFGLQFDSASPISAMALPLEPPAPNNLPQLRPPAKRTKPVAVKDGVRISAKSRVAEKTPATLAPRASEPKTPDSQEAPPSTSGPPAEADERPVGQVVQLDAFRKK